MIISATAVHKKIETPEKSLSILKGVDLFVNGGESISIVGRSGSGKTTLLSLLAGLDLPSSGEIILDGKKISGMDEDSRASARLGRVGFIFQHFELLPHYTALENVMLPWELSGQKHGREKATQLLKKLGLEKRLDHFPKQLSGGEQQRVAIARAFINDPKILFADEPTGSLDTATGQMIVDFLFKLNEEHHCTLVFVTHENGLAERCNKAYFLKNGKLSPYNGEK